MGTGFLVPILVSPDFAFIHIPQDRKPEKDCEAIKSQEKCCENDVNLWEGICYRELFAFAGVLLVD
jgi:hypothetical protein